jgi:membrane fusion protein (multidrug efflux system)
MGIVLIATLLFTAGGCQRDPDGHAKPRAGEKAKSPAHLVELVTVSEETLSVTSVRTGSLRHRRKVRIYNQEEGRVTRLPYYEGDQVQAGDILLELDQDLLMAELEKAIAVRRETKANLERLRGLRENRMVAENEYLRASTAYEVAKAEHRVLETRLGYTRVTAPFSGVVTARMVEPGDIVPRHSLVMSLADPSSLVTDLTVSELLIPHLHTGDTVRVRIDALGADEHPGNILRVHPELDARTRQGRVEIELSPVPPGARAGQFARVAFDTRAFNRMVIPFAALRRDRDGEFVYRMQADRTVRRVDVRSGQRLAQRVEVLEGLSVGEQVVLKGFLGLTDGKQVEPVETTPAASITPTRAVSAEEQTGS